MDPVPSSFPLGCVCGLSPNAGNRKRKNRTGQKRTIRLSQRLRRVLSTPSSLNITDCRTEDLCELSLQSAAISIRPSQMAPTILVINPNSSTSITDGLRSSLKAIKPSFVELEFYTAPSHAAKAISDFRTMNSTSTHCYEDLLANGAFRKFDAFLVCCCKYLRGSGKLITVS